MGGTTVVTSDFAIWPLFLMTGGMLALVLGPIVVSIIITYRSRRNDERRGFEVRPTTGEQQDDWKSDKPTNDAN